jgi:DNA-binding transcriptional ArsR family regulator
MQFGRTAPAILDVLGDPIRRVLFARLLRRPSNVTVLAKGVPVTRSAVSRHLQLMKGCGLVEAERQGRDQVYRVCRDALAPLAAWTVSVNARLADG